ncbi:hypothetical protein Tco_0378309 [Tanacetum coccineum]
MGHGSGHGSAHGSVLIHDEEDDSPVEETSPVKPKKPSRRATKANKDEPKEVKDAPKEWTVEEEIALCQGWCNVSKNNISGNSMKAKGFWEAIIRYFEKETSSTRGYDSIVSKWKNMVRPKIGAFVPSSKILKRITKVGRKKSRTSEITSGSASETQEFRPMGRDRAKAKKKAVGSSSSIVDLVADKFYNMKQKKREKIDKEQHAYMEMKNRELNIREAETREIAQLKREKLEIQRRTLELAEKEKRDIDILFYNSIIDTNLPPIQQQKLLEMKMEIKERYNLDY